MTTADHRISSPQQNQFGRIGGPETETMDMKRKFEPMHSLTHAALWSIGCTALALGVAGCATGLSTPSSSGSLPVSLAQSGITGNVHGGQQPVIGAQVQLYAVGSTGLGSAATPLIAAGAQVVYNGNPNTGALTDSSGNFRITGDYTCPTPSPQVYLVARGGNSGSGANSAIALMAPLGDCATLVANAATTYVQINEVTTIAAAYALAPFTTGYANVGASVVNSPGLIHAVANFNNLANVATGLAGGGSLPTGAVVPTTEINTLGDILAACINTASNTSAPCNTLFTATGSTDTIGAALAFAKNPGSSTLTALYSLSSANAPFQPTYTATPSDWTMAIRYTASGALTNPYGIAIDAAGNAWVSNTGGSSVVELSSSGAPLTTLTGGGLIGPKGVAIDRTGNVWIANPTANSVVEFSNAGILLSGSGGYTAGGLNGPVALALDSAGNAWVGNLTGNTVTELSSTGAATLSTLTAGGTVSGPAGIALDASGNVYIANSGGGNVVKMSHAGAAVGTPLSDVALQGTSAVALDSGGNTWAAGSTTGSAVAGAVSQFNSSGVASSYSPLGNGGLNLPVGVATSGTTAWVSNGLTTGSLSQLTAGGIAPGSPAAGLGSSETPVGGLAGPNTPVGVAVDPSGSVWTANMGDNTVSVFIGLTAPVVTPLAANVGP